MHEANTKWVRLWDRRVAVVEFCEYRLKTERAATQNRRHWSSTYTLLMAASLGLITWSRFFLLLL